MSEETLVKRQAGKYLDAFQKKVTLQDDYPTLDGISGLGRYMDRLSKSNQWLLTKILLKLEEQEDKINTITNSMVPIVQRQEELIEKINALDQKVNDVKIDDITKKLENLSLDQDLSKQIKKLDDKVSSLPNYKKSQPEFGWTRDKVDTSWMWPKPKPRPDVDLE